MMNNKLAFLLVGSAACVASSTFGMEQSEEKSSNSYGLTVKQSFRESIYNLSKKEPGVFLYLTQMAADKKKRELKLYNNSSPVPSPLITLAFDGMVQQSGTSMSKFSVNPLVASLLSEMVDGEGENARCKKPDTYTSHHRSHHRKHKKINNLAFESLSGTLNLQ